MFCLKKKKKNIALSRREVVGRHLDVLFVNCPRLFLGPIGLILKLPVHACNKLKYNNF